jgi:hypothetical protein
MRGYDLPAVQHVQGRHGLFANDCSNGGPLVACGGSTGTGTGGAVCSSLAACCPLLTGGSVGACNEVAAEGDETVCSSYLGLAQVNGLCTGS